MQVLVFGCFHRVGHHSHGAGWDELPPRLRRELEIWCDSREDTRHSLQNEGEALVRHGFGYTAIDWWDRLGPDARFGSHTVVLAKGNVDPRELLAAAREQVPWAFRVEVRL